MPVPTWVVGQVLASADVNAWFVPLAAVATNDLSVPSSTGVPDTALQLTVAANATYAVELYVRYNGPASTAFNFQLTGPAGAALSASGGTTNSQDITLGAVFPGIQTTGAGNDLTLVAIGTLVTASSSGTFQLQLAQGITTSPASVRRARSRLTLRRIG